MEQICGYTLPDLAMGEVGSVIIHAMHLHIAIAVGAWFRQQYAQGLGVAAVQKLWMQQIIASSKKHFNWDYCESKLGEKHATSARKSDGGKTCNGFNPLLRHKMCAVLSLACYSIKQPLVWD